MNLAVWPFAVVVDACSSVGGIATFELLHVPTLDIFHHFYILVFSTGPIGAKLGRNVHGDGYF